MLPTAALVILCSQPGFRRAGLAHPARAQYAPDHFTQEQLELMAAEPRLQLLPIEIVAGEGAAGSATPSGPVPQSAPSGGDAPGGTAEAPPGPLPGNATAGGDPVTDTAPMSSTHAPQGDGGEGSDAGASTAGAATDAAPAADAGGSQVASSQAGAEGVSGDASPAPAAATRTGRRNRANG